MITHSGAFHLLVMRPSCPLEDRPLEHPSGASRCSHSKLIHTASEVPQLPASPDVKYIEHHSGLVPGVAGVLAAVGDHVLFIGAEVNQSHLQHHMTVANMASAEGALDWPLNGHSAQHLAAAIRGVLLVKGGIDQSALGQNTADSLAHAFARGTKYTCESCTTQQEPCMTQQEHHCCGGEGRGGGGAGEWIAALTTTG